MCKTKVILILLFLLTLLGCNQYKSCYELTNIAKSAPFKSQANEFIKKYISGITKENTLLGGGMIPGRYWYYPASFDWEAVKLSKKFSQIRIIGQLSDIKAISFQERSRIAILVKAPNSDSFGVNEKHLFQIDNRTAVYCLINK